MVGYIFTVFPFVGYGSNFFRITWIQIARGKLLYYPCCRWESINEVEGIFVFCTEKRSIVSHWCLWQELAASIDEEDVEKFTDAIKEFDSITKLVIFLIILLSCLVLSYSLVDIMKMTILPLWWNENCLYW